MTITEKEIKDTKEKATNPLPRSLIILQHIDQNKARITPKIPTYSVLDFFKC